MKGCFTFGQGRTEVDNIVLEEGLSFREVYNEEEIERGYGDNYINAKKKRQIDLHLLPQADQLYCQKSPTDKTWIIDGGVYTRNRNFRLFLSSKAGISDRCRILKISPDNEFVPKNPIGASIDKAFFLSSLISNVFEAAPLITAKELPYVDIPRPKQWQNDNVAVKEHCIAASVEDFNRLYPKFIKYFKRVFFDRDNKIQGRIRGIPSFSPFRGNGVIVFTVDHYRYCSNIKRHHKSNHIYIVVDKNREVWYQKCHDIDCKDYSTMQQPLPAGVVREIEENYR